MPDEPVHDQREALLGADPSAFNRLRANLPTLPVNVRMKIIPRHGGLIVSDELPGLRAPIPESQSLRVAVPAAIVDHFLRQAGEHVTVTPADRCALSESYRVVRVETPAPKTLGAAIEALHQAATAALMAHARGNPQDRYRYAGDAETLAAEARKLAARELR